MKILVLPSWYPPLGGRFFEELSVSISNSGADVDILVNQEKSVKQFCIKDIFTQNVFSKTENVNVYTTVFYRIPKLNILNEKRFIKSWFRNYEAYAKKNGHPDLIHVHSAMWAGAVAQLIFSKYAVPYVITEHRSRFIFNTPEAKAMLKNRFIPLINKALKTASYITTVSQALNNKLIDIESSVKNKIMSIPNTIDSSDFFYMHKSSDNEAFTFFSLGNLFYVKGFDILLEAFSLLIKKHSFKIKLRIGGNGPELQNLQMLAEKLNIINNIKFLLKLNRQEVIEEMQKSNAFVLPSRFEAFGVVFIEAGACGLPVIGANSGGPSYIINPENGILCENENVKSLVNAMDKMINNYNSFNKEKISEETIKKYDKTTVAKQYINLFNTVLND